MPRKHRLPILIICLFLAYQAYSELTHDYAPIRTNPIEGDFAAYAAVLTQAEYPENFERDLLYGSQKQSEVRRGNTWLYMLILENFHKLTGNDLEVAIRWFSIMAQGIYLIGMYLWLFALTEDQLIAIGLSLVSLKASGFMAAGNSWGFQAEVVFPFHLFTVFSPFYLTWIYQRWFKTGSASWYEILGLGIVGGLALNFIHSLSGGALLQLVLLMAGFLWISRQVRVWTIPVFILGVLATLPLYLPNRPDGFPLTYPAAQEIISFGQQYSMIFPWRVRDLSPIGWSEDVRTFYENFLLAYLPLSAVTYFSGRRLGYALFILVQVAFIFLFVNMGWLPIFLGAISLYQIWRGTWDGWQKYLWVFAGFALLLGPFQQLLLFRLWQDSSDTTLISYLFELARLSHFFYLIFYGLAAVSFYHLLPTSKPIFQRTLLIIGLCGLVWYSLNLIPYPLNESSFYNAILIISALILLAWWKWGFQLPDTLSAKQEYGMIGFIGGLGLLGWASLTTLGLSSLALIGLILILAGLFALMLSNWRMNYAIGVIGLLVAGYLVGLDLPVQNANGYTLTFAEAMELSADEREALAPPPLRFQITPDFIDMVEWIKTETPPDSLLHISDFDRSLRYYGQRSLLFASQEWLLSLFTGPDPYFMRQLENELRQSQYDPTTFFELLKRYKVDYLILRKELAGWTEPYPEPIQFENDTYLIYHLGN